jgi:hypothetical protein
VDILFVPGVVKILRIFKVATSDFQHGEKEASIAISVVSGHCDGNNILNLDFTVDNEGLLATLTQAD